jgi:hypothetical protein
MSMAARNRPTCRTGSESPRRLLAAGWRRRPARAHRAGDQGVSEDGDRAERSPLVGVPHPDPRGEDHLCRQQPLRRASYHEVRSAKGCWAANWARHPPTWRLPNCCTPGRDRCYQRPAPRRATAPESQGAVADTLTRDVGNAERDLAGSMWRGAQGLCMVGARFWTGKIDPRRSWQSHPDAPPDSY